MSDGDDRRRLQEGYSPTSKSFGARKGEKPPQKPPPKPTDSRQAVKPPEDKK